MSSHLPGEVWAIVQASVPILCVDVVPHRSASGSLRVGLIRRRYADTGRPVWCHLGGRVRRGETIDEAAVRHVDETLMDAHPHIPRDAQPHHVMQWFPSSLRDGATYGHDSRKHAVSLCWSLDLGPRISVRDGGEGTHLAWFSADLSEVDDTDLWPGTRHLVAATLRGASLVP